MKTYTYKGYCLEYIYVAQEDAFHAYTKVGREHLTFTAKSVTRLQKLFKEKMDMYPTLYTPCVKK